MSKSVFLWFGILFFFILSILFFNFEGMGIGFDLDPSYMWATSYFAFDDNQIGSVPIFTYGPLGFLIIPTVYSYSILSSFIFEAYCNLSLFFFLNKFLNKKTLFSNLFIYIITFGSILFFPIDHRIMLLCYLVALDTYKNLKIVKSFHLFTLLFVLVFIKSMYLFLILSLLPIWLYLFYRKRNRFLLIVAPVASFLLLALLVRIIFNYSLTDLYNMLRGYFEFSMANSSAMTQADGKSIKWIYFFSYIILTSLLWLSFKKKTVYPFFFPSFLIGNFIYFKYAMARSDHAWVFIYLAVIFYILFFIYSFNSLKTKNISHISYLISLALLHLYVFSTPGGIYWNVIAINRLTNFRIDINKVEKLFRLISEPGQKRITIPNLIPKEMIDIIGKESVDIFPHQVGRVLASGLSWKNRPVYQSYITSSEWLIQQNVNFFNDREKSPTYIIFNKPYAIDYRYLLNDELQTFLLIRDRYESILIKDDFLLLKKKNNEIKSDNLDTKLIQKSKPNSTIIFENEFIQKSPTGNNICVGSLDIRKSLYGILKKILYKEEPIYIAYYLSDDSYRIFRYIPGLGKSGILIYPFLESSSDLYDFFSKKERAYPIVTGISIYFETNESSYEKKFEIEIRCAN